MSMNPLNDISSVYLKEVLKPQLGKGAAAPAKKEGGEKPSAEGGEKKEGDASAGSAKRVRQAVYDIRYRARREEIPVQQAYNQYMSHTTMTGPEKSEVKSKLGEERVVEEVEEKKFQVRVTDKNSGKSYVRMATREKINQLRANPNISSVEMTKYGSPYEGEKRKGEQTAAVKSGKGLSKKDYDGDGKVESGAKEYRGAVHNAIQRKKGGKADGQDTSSVKEGFSNWRQDLVEIVDEIKSENGKKIKEKNVKNKITINPPLKEAVENLGGELLEVEEVQLDEVSPPSAKAERMVKHIKKGYAKDGKLTKKEKSIAYATAWKQYNKEDFEIEEAKQTFPAKKVAKQMEKARKGSVYGRETKNVPSPQVSDSEKKNTTRFSKMFHASEKAKREKQDAAKASRSSTFYKDTHPASPAKMKKANEEIEFVEQNLPSNTGVTKQPTGSTKSTSKTQSTAQDAQRKQQVQQLRTMIMKKRQLQNQELALQKQGKLPVDTHATEEFHLDELNRYEKETGKSSGSLNMPKGRPTKKGGETDPVMRSVRQSMRKQSGTPVGQQKKEKGKKPPVAGEYGAPASPAQKVAKRRAAAQRSQDMMHSRFD
jgi:hypothetical protein